MSKYGAFVVGALVSVLIILHGFTGEPAPSETPADARWWEIGTEGPRRVVPEKADFPGEFKRVILSQASAELGVLDGALASMLADGDIETVREKLLRVAAEAAVRRAHTTLGRALSLLGQLAAESQDFDAAAVYFEEALDVYGERGDAVGIAEVYMGLGKMHLKLRQRARIAGKAYDRLLLARWQLSHGELVSAEANLRLVIEENLTIHRYGAAAGAYKSLMRLYAETGYQSEFVVAATDAARLYAASGQLDEAQWLIDVLADTGVEQWQLGAIEHEIDLAHAEFIANTRQIAIAEDYRRLYRHYRSLGDDERAWRLRTRADASLRLVSKRAMYRRNPDVLAVLYASLNDVERAQAYFDRASRTFDEFGRSDLTLRAQRLARALH